MEVAHIGMVVIDVKEAIVLEVAQDHRGVVADTHVAGGINGETLPFSWRRAPAKLKLLTFPSRPSRLLLGIRSAVSP